VSANFPSVQLTVDARGRGELRLDGIKVAQCTAVEIIKRGTGPALVKFELLARVECEIHPDGFKAVITEVT
jgi:hypothetical protein